MPAPGSGRTDQLIEELQARVQREPGRSDAWVELGRTWVRKARESADPGLYLSAQDCAAAALELDPGHRTARLLQGMVLLNDHRFDEARQLASALVEGEPRDPTALGILSDALLELGRFEEAAEVVQRMVDLRPDLPSYIRASHLMWLRGDVRSATETAHLAIQVEGDWRDPEPRAWATVQAAMLQWHQGDYSGADAGFTRALEAIPGYAPALVGKGRVALARGDGREAAWWLERALDAAPLPETAWLLGDARLVGGDEQGARTAYDLVVRQGRAFDRRTLALFFATKNRDHQEAVRLAEEERKSRDDIYSEDAYAWALFRAGRIVEARAATEKAMRLSTPDARLLFHAGAIRLASGERKAGRSLLRAALRMNPGFDLSGAQEARRLLRR
jgi:tetratricopeptide (TPR) repeat protein